MGAQEEPSPGPVTGREAPAMVGGRKPPCCLRNGGASEPWMGWGWGAPGRPGPRPLVTVPPPCHGPAPSPPPPSRHGPDPHPRPLRHSPGPTPAARPPPSPRLPGGVTPPSAPGSGGLRRPRVAGRALRESGAEGGVPRTPARRPAPVMSQSRPAPASPGRRGAVGCEAASQAGGGPRGMACPRPLPRRAAPRAGPPRRG